MNTHTRDRAHTDHATVYTELWLIGTPDEIAALTHLAKTSGTLVYRSHPKPMGGNDPRHQVHLRLLFPH